MGISGRRGDLRKDVEIGDPGRERGDPLEVFYPWMLPNAGGHAPRLVTQALLGLLSAPHPPRLRPGDLPDGNLSHVRRLPVL